MGSILISICRIYRLTGIGDKCLRHRSQPLGKGKHCEQIVAPGVKKVISCVVTDGISQSQPHWIFWTLVKKISQMHL